VEVGEVMTLEQSFPKGTYVIPTAQFLGRLVTHMLEPETDDNVVYWNTMDAWIPRPGEAGQGEGDDEDMAPPRGTPPAGFPPGFGGQRQEQGPPILPIYKLMKPAALTTLLLNETR
jgi:hypothetical protein